MEQKPLDVLILAAGLGTRMRSARAKVLHRLDGRPLVNHVCRTAASLLPRKVYVIVGHQEDDVRQAVLEELDERHVKFVRQESQLGTGDAVNSARQFLEKADSTVLVLSGDVPMIRTPTLEAVVRQHHSHRGRGAACTILTVILSDPTGYGRIVRDSGGIFERIVEEKDATRAEKRIEEINAGIYCFDSGRLFAALSRVDNSNAQGEYYLTDVPRIMGESGESVAIYKHMDASEIEGINDRIQLAAVEEQIREATLTKLMRDFGVTLIDPASTYVSSAADVGRDTVLYPNVMIEGETKIGEGCTVRSNTRISDSVIGDDVEILESCVISGAKLRDGCRIGPFAHLRPIARIEEGAKVGNFVEVKKSVLGRNSKASHLTYLGDAKVGENTNIGAGTITCNYDGKEKHETEIGDNVRIGSDTMLVAPIKVGDGSVTGAGTVATKDIPPNKIVVGVPGRAVRSVDEDAGKKQIKQDESGGDPDGGSRD